MRVWALGIALTTVMSAVAAEAHVTIEPRESKADAIETYVVRVPTEVSSPTVSVQLTVPDGVTIMSVAGASDTYEITKDGNRAVAITWHVDIPSGRSERLTFVARNPASATDIAWKVRQRYKDGTSSDWIEPAGSRRPGPVTKVIAADSR